MLLFLEGLPEPLLPCSLPFFLDDDDLEDLEGLPLEVVDDELQTTSVSTVGSHALQRAAVQMKLRERLAKRQITLPYSDTYLCSREYGALSMPMMAQVS